MRNREEKRSRLFPLHIFILVNAYFVFTEMEIIGLRKSNRPLVITRGIFLVKNKL